MNDFSNRPDEALRLAGGVAAARLAQGGYPLDPEAIGRVAAAAAAYSESLRTLAEARARLTSAVVGKDECRESLAAILSETAGTLTRDPSVDNVALAAAGFAVRPPRAPRPVPARTVEDLSLRIVDGGDLLLSWPRGTNGRSTVFQIEVAQGGPFALAAITTRTRHRLTGLARGQETLVRVVASTSTTRAAPSVPVVAYARASA